MLKFDVFDDVDVNTTPQHVTENGHAIQHTQEIMY